MDLRPDLDLRVGHGHDTHRLTRGKSLILGGVALEHDRGLDGHSDADVLLHAVTDALFGAAGLGDIGQWFPDTDPKWAGADSAQLLTTCVQEVRAKNWTIVKPKPISAVAVRTHDIIVRSTLSRVRSQEK